MAIRLPDVIELRGPPGTLSIFEEVEIVQSLLAPTEAKFVIGDDRYYDFIFKDTEPGQIYEVWLNGHPLLKGRVSAREVPITSQNGCAIELAVQTKFSDAVKASADTAIRVHQTTINEFLVLLFAQHGYVESDFVFSPATARNLITGATKHGKEDPNLPKIQIMQAMVQPPETVLECATRHLIRHGLMIWEMGDGRICVGQVASTDAPMAILRCRRDAEASGSNNVLEARKINDWRDIASEVRILGATGGEDAYKRPLQGFVVDTDVNDVAKRADKHFVRPIRMPIEAGKTKEMVFIQAQRELSARRRRANGWEILVDGWTYWDGDRAINWCINETVDVQVDAAGGNSGANVIYRCAYRMGAQGQFCQMSMLRQGLWDLGEPT